MGTIYPKAGYTIQAHLGRLSCLHLISSETVPAKVMEMLLLEVLSVEGLVVWSG